MKTVIRLISGCLFHHGEKILTDQSDTSYTKTSLSMVNWLVGLVFTFLRCNKQTEFDIAFRRNNTLIPKTESHKHMSPTPFSWLWPSLSVHCHAGHFHMWIYLRTFILYYYNMPLGRNTYYIYIYMYNGYVSTPFVVAMHSCKEASYTVFLLWGSCVVHVLTGTLN